MRLLNTSATTWASGWPRQAVNPANMPAVCGGDPQIPDEGLQADAQACEIEFIGLGDCLPPSCIDCSLRGP